MTPKISTHVFDECKDEVLHVSFSPNGQMLAICSKDAVFRIYDADYPYSNLFSKDMSNSNCIKWEWCQAATFSPNSQKFESNFQKLESNFQNVDRKLKMPTKI